MPEYFQVQCYAPLSGDQFPASLDIFCDLLIKNGAPAASLATWRGDLMPASDEFGITHIMEMTAPPTWELGKLRLQPYLMVWDYWTGEPWPERWLECGILLSMENNILEQSLTGLENLLLALADTFGNTPVFLTNEMQDGQPWDQWRSEITVDPAHFVALAAQAKTPCLPEAFSAPNVQGARVIWNFTEE